MKNYILLFPKCILTFIEKGVVGVTYTGDNFLPRGCRCPNKKPCEKRGNFPHVVGRGSHGGPQTIQATVIVPGGPLELIGKI